MDSYENKNLEDIVKSEYEEIDIVAQLQKIGIHYIAELVKREWDKLVSVFGHAERISQEAYIFDKTRKTIYELVNEYDTPGVRFLGKYPNPLPPEMKLGWAELQPNHFKDIYSPQLTEEGRKIRSEYLEVTCLIEKINARAKQWRDLIEAGKKASA